MSFRHNTYYNLQANNNFHLQQPDTSKGFTNLFSDSYLDQLLLASTNTTAANFNNSSDSSPTSSSSVSEAGCSPPRTFLSDGIIDGLLPFSSMTGLDTLRRDKNIIAQPIITKESYQQQIQEDFITKTAIVQQKCSSNNNNSKNKYGITTNKKKKNKIVGQSTMSIKLVSSQKTLRPSRKIECFNCKVKKTPLWRRTPDRLHSLCNACGLYYKQYNSHRPLHVRNKTIRAQHPQYAVNEHIVPMTINMNNNKQQPSPSSTSSSSSSIEAASGSHSDDNSNGDQECTNCHQTQTPLWRKNNRGEPLCNACGLYAKLHHRDRPVEMRKSTIQRRRRDWATIDNDTTIYVQEEVEDEGVEREEVEEEEYVDGEEERSRRRNISFTAETSLPNHIDSRFQSLLVSMNREQMRSFLNMMERRCDFLKAILEPGSS